MLELKLLRRLPDGQATLKSDQNFDLPEFPNALMMKQRYTNDREILFYVRKINQVTFHRLH